MDMSVTFVPMAAVDADKGAITTPEVRYVRQSANRAILHFLMAHDLICKNQQLVWKMERLRYQ